MEDKNASKEDSKQARRLGESMGSDESIRAQTVLKEEAFKLMMENILEDDFRLTRRSGLVMFFLPLSINVWFSFVRRGRYLKNLLSVGSLMGSYGYFHYCLTNEANEFLKKDSKDANVVRENVNYIHALRLSTPDFIEESKEVLANRNIKEG